MHRLAPPPVAALAVVGCVGVGVAPANSTLDVSRRVHVVAIESPPLLVPASTGGIFLLGPSPGFAVFNTIQILVQLPEASRRGAQASGRLQATLDDMGKWTPTLELATELQRQLAARGHLGTVEDEIKPLPGITDRTCTALLENWLAPIRAWYNDATPTTGYEGPPSLSDTAVFEMGVSNSEIAFGELLIQVHVKVIDAASGRVIGRARASNSMHMPTQGDAARSHPCPRRKGLQGDLRLGGPTADRKLPDSTWLLAVMGPGTSSDVRIRSRVVDGLGFSRACPGAWGWRSAVIQPSSRMCCATIRSWCLSMRTMNFRLTELMSLTAPDMPRRADCSATKPTCARLSARMK
jgi:hypothetical protein